MICTRYRPCGRDSNRHDLAERHDNDGHLLQRHVGHHEFDESFQNRQYVSLSGMTMTAASFGDMIEITRSKSGSSPNDTFSLLMHPFDTIS